jgi:inner membrane protein involved in colicin E2 resistance
VRKELFLKAELPSQVIGILLVMVSSSVVALPFTTLTQEDGASLTGAMVSSEGCQYWRKFVNNY